MRFLVAMLCAFQALSASAQLTIVLSSVPANTPPDATIYVAGNFNGWDPGHPDYALTHTGSIYHLTFSPPTGTLEFKFTRGSWATVEGTSEGGFLPNRTYVYGGGVDTLVTTIAGWEDLGGSTSTAADNVMVLTDSFYIPQLDRYRRVWLYLPPDYDSSDKHYPVLYMQDGQNVFDQATSFAGEWQVDETLNQLFAQGDPGCIVVAVDNGGALRLSEYSPWFNEQYQAGGEGEAMADFFALTLKPWIDAHYRTLPDRDHTGIMGSSLGGLISLYAFLKHQDVFGRVGSFSPAYWFNPEIYDYALQQGRQAPARIYTLAGGEEDPGITQGAGTMHQRLQQAGFAEGDELYYDIVPGGHHNEAFWAQEFGDAYLWLFAQTTPTTAPEPTDWKVWPNPADSVLWVQHDTRAGILEARFFDLSGKELYRTRLSSNRIDLTRLPQGIFLLQLADAQGTIQWSGQIEIAR